MLFALSTLALLAAVPLIAAQTYTDCNPLDKTDCPSDIALGTTASFNWTTESASDKVWNATNGVIDFETDGAEFTINEEGDAPTIQSIFYIFFGRVSVVMKAASGQGIVSSVVLESDDLDEIDWEMIGGNTSYVQTNFFGKGDTSTYDRAVWYPVDDTLAAHNYTTVWTAEHIQWLIDGSLVRTLPFNDSLAESTNSSDDPTPGDRYPQTPMTVRIGNWAGGDSASNGTVEWAGGKVDWSQAPFTQYVLSVEVEDYSVGKSYTYGNTSGAWESIVIAAGNSTIKTNLLDASASPAKTIEESFDSLSTGAKIAIAACSVAAAVALVVFSAFCCVRNRRAGRREKALADAEWEKQLAEAQHYRRRMLSERELHPRSGAGGRGGPKAGYI